MQKPPGAQFYPEDMTRAEFEAWNNPDKRNPYSLVQRLDSGNLLLVPYSAAFRQELLRAAKLLREPPTWPRTRPSPGICACVPKRS